MKTTLSHKNPFGPFFTGTHPLLYLDFFLAYAGLSFLFPEFFISIHNFLFATLTINTFNILTALGITGSLIQITQFFLMSIISLFLLRAQILYTNKMEHSFRKDLIEASCRALTVILLVHSSYNPADLSQGADWLINIHKGASVYLSFPTDDLHSLQQLVFLPKFSIFAVMNIAPMIVLYSFHQIIYSIDEHNVFKSFNKNHFYKIINAIFCHLIFLKPLAMIFYCLALGVYDDQLMMLYTRLWLNSTILFYLFYSPLAKILEAMLNRGDTLEDDTNYTV